MQEVLLRKLIEKNYFTAMTEVDATHKGIDLSGQPLHTFEGTFTVVKLLETKKTNALVLEVVSIMGDGARMRIRPDQITAIDGMTPERFAENYMIDPAGNDIKVVGKRRGRRPKNWNPETQSCD